MIADGIRYGERNEPGRTVLVPVTREAYLANLRMHYANAATEILRLNGRVPRVVTYAVADAPEAQNSESALLREFATEEGWRPTADFADSRRAAPKAERPGLLSACEAVWDGLADAILVRDRTHLPASSAEYEDLLRHLARCVGYVAVVRPHWLLRRTQQQSAT
ncbi:recombinase family protein [Streptomyces sp. NPDC002690]